ncbi:MAG TPA: hypothetical protein VGE66_20545 [Chitinophagaceae bacterium]
MGIKENHPQADGFLLGDSLILRSGVIIIRIGGTATKVAGALLIAVGFAATKMAQSRSPAVKYISRGSYSFGRLRASRNIRTFILATTDYSGIFCPGDFGISATTFTA